MRDAERWLIGLQLLTLAALGLVLVSLGELLARQRPRVIYVHQRAPGEPGEPIPIRRPPAATPDSKPAA